jgi:SAM-dependent methyltransferase
VGRPSTEESAALRGHAHDEGWWFQAKEEIVASFLRTRVRDCSRIVVLACGGGVTVRHLRRLAPGCSILGFDIDPAAIAFCATVDPDGRYEVVDLERELPCGVGTADVVVALDLLEHLEHDREVAQRVYDVLRPGGLFVVNVPAHPWLFSPHDSQLGHLRRYGPRQIDSMIADRGFLIRHSTPLFATTLLLLLAWRPMLRVSRQLATRSDVGRRLPRPIDRLLYAVARVEGWVARKGLPFGSSQLVLAEKPPAP